MIYIPHTLIFTKPKKVGGSTMEVLLSAVCTSDSIVTPLVPQEDIYRREKGYRLPTNVWASPEDEKHYQDALTAIANPPTTDPDGAPQRRSLTDNVNPIEQLKLLKQKTAINGHASAKRVRAFLGPSIFDHVPLISICRHPYELAISQAFWNHRKEPTRTLCEHIDSIVATPHANIRHYGLNRQWQGQRSPYQFIIRLEQLVDDLHHISESLDLNLPSEIPKMKGKVRLDTRPAEQIQTLKQQRAMETSNRDLFDLWDHPPRMALTRKP